MFSEFAPVSKLFPKLFPKNFSKLFQTFWNNWLWIFFGKKWFRTIFLNLIFAIFFTVDVATEAALYMYVISD
jgi:hypothetical protein